MQTDSLFLPPSKPQSTTGPQSHCHLHWFICKWLCVDGNKHNALDGDESVHIERNGCSQLFANQSGHAVCPAICLPRHIQFSGCLKASSSHIRAMSVASPLTVVKTLSFSNIAGFHHKTNKNGFVATPNRQRSWCFVQISCSLWEIELGYCISISTAMLHISTHLLVTAWR